MRDEKCDECGGTPPPGFPNCQAVFEHICALEYTEAAYGGAHLLTVDAYALQHSRHRGPRSNAFHLMRLCLILEQGASAALGARPPRAKSKAFERQLRDFPYLAPPTNPGRLTICDVHGATTAEEHLHRVRVYAISVWDAWISHQDWARRSAVRGDFA